MKIELIPSPGEEDVLLRITEPYVEIHRIVFTRPELHQLDWAIRKYLEEQPSRNLKEVTGGGKAEKGGEGGE